MYKYYQPNKKDIKDKYGDCVFRALCKVMGMEWLELFDDINKVAREIQCPANCRTCYSKYLEINGFRRGVVSNKRGTTRPTVESFAKTHKKGVYYLKVANHCVAVVDGVYYDTWDSGNKCVYSYWEKV